MAVVQPTPVFGAIEKQLKTLCLREFPCGTGSWREPEPVNKLSKKYLKHGQLKSLRLGREKLPFHDKAASEVSDLEAVKLLAQREKSSALQELVGSHFSPWHLDYSWSDEAKELREIAVKSPWLIDRNFVLNYFKTLRIVDKNVTDVDDNVLKLANLEELTLSANYISTVNSKNLPRSLKVLELCANKISDISALCVRPPLLHHLGLGYNKISFVGDYITGDFWPNLLSLDLSHNDLCDLMDIIRKITTLPKLRNLVLQGNPLSLIPGYRGYTIDCLRRLSVMDDIHISADEKHHFKGLARRREFILDEAKVQIGVPYIKGLPCPEEIKNPENQPEFPVVERTYFVQFMFPEERCGKGDMEVPTEAVDDLADFTALDMEAAGTERHEDESEGVSVGLSLPRATSGKSSEAMTQGPLTTERNVLFDSRPQMKSAEVFSNPGPSSVASFPRPNPNHDPEVQPGSEVEGINLGLLEEIQEQEGEDGKTGRSDKTEPTPRIKLAPINTDPQPWGEELELNWTIDLTRDDLLALRDFFKQGMDFTVVEQVILGYPAEPDTASDKPAEGKDKKKPPTPKGKDAGKDKGKKKKEPEIELVKSPPTYTTIAAFHITLENFLEGEFDYRNIFTKGDVPPPSTIRSTDMDDKKSDKKDSKKKAGDKAQDKNKNAKDTKKSPRDKDKKGGKGAKHAEEAEEDDSPPPPLELEVTVKLHHWVTALDSVKEDEEKKSLQGGKKDKSGSKETLKH